MNERASPASKLSDQFDDGQPHRQPTSQWSFPIKLHLQTVQAGVPPQRRSYSRNAATPLSLPTDSAPPLMDQSGAVVVSREEEWNDGEKNPHLCAPWGGLGEEVGMWLEMHSGVRRRIWGFNRTDYLERRSKSRYVSPREFECPPRYFPRGLLFFLGSPGRLLLIGWLAIFFVNLTKNWQYLATFDFC